MRIKPTDNTAANPVINMFNHLPNPAASFAQMGFAGMIPPPGVAGMPVPPPGLPPPHILEKSFTKSYHSQTKSIS